MYFVNDNIRLNYEYAIALVNFDGIHLGHRCVIETAKSKAIQLGCKSALLTFWPHPSKILKQDKFHEILSLEDKITMIKSIGIDEVFIIDFSLDFSQTSAEEFIKHLCQKLKIKSITTGYNFRFGHNRNGNVETLHRLKNFYGFEYNAINQIYVNGCVISSSVLRKVLHMGCVKLFSEFIGRKYTVECNISYDYQKIANFVQSAAGKKVFFAEIINTGVLLPPVGAYLVKIQEDYFTLFLMEDKKVFLVAFHEVMLENNITIEFIQIIKQYKNIDKSSQSKLLIDSCIKGSKTCLK